MVKIPHLPEKEELEFREKEFILKVREQFAASNKIWFYALLAVAALSIPVGIGLKTFVARSLISSYEPPVVNVNLYDPDDIVIIKTGVLPVITGAYSAYVQIANPNAELTAWDIQYRFVFSDSTGQVLLEEPGETYSRARASKFLIAPRVNLDNDPASVTLEFDRIRWTTRTPEFEVGFDVLQQNSGVSEEGNFFVEAEVRNRQNLRVKKVEVSVLIFDTTNENLLAVNQTEFSDLLSFENRYFRVLWPEPFAGIGQIQIIPSVDPLDPGVVLEEGEGIPVR